MKGRRRPALLDSDTPSIPDAPRGPCAFAKGCVGPKNCRPPVSHAPGISEACAWKPSICTSVRCDGWHITQAGIPMMTSMPVPDSLRGKPYTVSSGVYSLGVVFYKLLAGRPKARFWTCGR